MKTRISFIILCFFLYSCDIYSEKSGENKEVMASIRIAMQNIDRNTTKATLYIDKALEHKDKLDKKTLVKLYEAAGKVYRTNAQYLQSLVFFKKQLELQQNINPGTEHYIYNDIGIVYTRLNNAKLARDYYTKSLQGLQNQKSKQNETQIYNVYNNLAVLELNDGNVVKALEIFTKCKDLCQKTNDVQGLVMTYQNISIANTQLKEYDNALEYFYKAKYLAKKHNLNFDFNSINYNLGYLFKYNIKNIDSAKYYFNKSYEFANKYQFPMIIRGSAYELVKIYEDEKQFEKANIYLHISKDLDEKEIKEQNGKKINELEFNFNQKLHQQETINHQRKNLFIVIISCIFLTFIVSAGILMYQLQKNKLKARTVEKNLLAKKLEERNRELTGKTLEIMKAGEIIGSTHKELTELTTNRDLTSQNKLSKIIHDLKTDLKGFNKEEFNKVFIETNSDFYKNLLKIFPNMTKNELRLCAFLKMNLSTKEISAITNQSINSIIIARHRLRKKMKIDNEKQSLYSFLSQFY